MTNRRKRIYEIALIVCCFIIIGLSAYMGITAIQKSMQLNVEFQMNPSFECKIVYKGNTIFCNTTDAPEGLMVGDGISLSGNNLILNQEFSGLGAEFTLTIHNYTTTKTEISVSGTGANDTTLTLDAYTGGTAPYGDITITATGTSATLTFAEWKATIDFNLTNASTTISNGTKLPMTGEYSAAITPKTGYGFNTFNIVGISAGGYSWEPSTGLFTITDWTKVAENVVITCTASPNTYTITYNLDGGANNTNNPQSYTIESSVITLQTPTKTGYDFAGWTGTGLNNATTTVTIANGSTGNKSYTANWTLHTYTITYELDGGTLATGQTNPTSYTVESADITLKEPTKDGHTFLGWTGSNGSTAQTSVTITNGSTGDKSYTATWKANAYTIKFELNLESAGTFSEEVGRIGILITNNSSLSFSFTNDWSGSLCCESSNNSSVQLYDVTPGTCPIKDAFNGDGYEYIEKYYNETGTGQTLKHDAAVQPGYDIYIFLHTYYGSPYGATQFISYSDGGVSIFYDMVIKYTPTSNMTITATSDFVFVDNN